jgi:sialate O-acetylesterase
MSTSVRVHLIAALVLSFALARPSPGQLRLPRLFEDGMVLQRGATIPVRGEASPDEALTLTFAGNTYSTTADADGRWTVRLPPAEAGGPFELRVTGSSGDLQLRDVLVGDVWVASCQSNMEWTVADSDGEPGQDADVRQFKVPLTWSYVPQDTLVGGAWEVADPMHVEEFTAVGYYFARALRKHHNVPIGIINTTWGGSRIESWMSAETLELDAAALGRIFEEERAHEDAIRESVVARLGSFPETDPGLVDDEAVWASPDLDDRHWLQIPVPAPWESVGYEGMDGVGWYRTTFDLTADEAASEVMVGLGMIDDSDISWVNGVEIGRMDMAWTKPRVYAVPPAALRPGRNVIAVRVEDFHGGGGIAGPPESVFLQVAEERRSLSGQWRFMVGAVRFGPVGDKHHVPTLLWNQMVRPLTSYPVKGFIWYQGESNADSEADAEAYQGLFADLIRSWRAAWGRRDAPFLWAQLASYMSADDEPASRSNWAVLRESQSAALALPNTAQAILLDIGDAEDIHPRNKRDVGERLALAARRIAYGEDIVHSGPTYRSYQIREDRVIVAFDHANGGLDVRGAGPGGFAIAGSDRRFVWATARVEDDRVVVWSDRVPEPVAVRYGWGNNPVSANLYNSEGLPAAPFRTDDW